MHPDTSNTKSVQQAYQMTGGDGDLAIEQGWANAVWYKCTLTRPQVKGLIQRQDAVAIRDTLIWFSLIAASGVLAYLFASILRRIESKSRRKKFFSTLTEIT